MSKATELRAELDKLDHEAFELDRVIELLRGRLAEKNARRKQLEIDFQREDALEAQARLAGH